MNALITEMKTRAKLLLKLLHTEHVAAKKRALMLSRKQNWELPTSWQLRHCLNLVSADAGFTHWDHARRVLSAEALPGEDMGDFWHGREVEGFANRCFDSYAEAQQQLQQHLLQQPLTFLLPYRRQFMLVQADYLRALDLQPDATAWRAIAHDVVQAHGTPAWLDLCKQRLRTSRFEHLFADWDLAQVNLDLQSSEQEAKRVMQSFVKDGRLIKIPEQRKKRLVILRWLVEQLQPERQYSEPEMNEFLWQFHEDHATLRREFIINALMKRENGVYWRT